MLIICMGTFILVALVFGKAVHLVRTSQMPGIEDMEPRDPRLGRF